MANVILQKPMSFPPIRFVREVIAELKKVTWPTRQETIKLTMVVVTVAGAIGLFVGGLDVALVNLSRMLFK
jgi:preprotein translocase subunit SecE